MAAGAEASTNGARSRRIVLHIGPPKTGTTYLQSMLWRNRRGLARRGVLVPGAGISDHFQAAHDVLERKRPPGHPSPPWDGAFDALVADVDRSGAHTGVISCEDLSFATKAQVERTLDRLDGFEVVVVYGLRPLAGQLSSAWQESVKIANQLGLDEWLAEIRRRDPETGFWTANDVESVVERWRPAGGQLHVLMLPGSGAPADALWQRFLGVVGTSLPRSASVRRANESLGYVEAMLLARVQAHLPRRAPRQRTRDVIKRFLVPHVLAGRPNGLPIVLPESDRAWIDAETTRRRDVLHRDDVAVVGDLGELDVPSAGFGSTSLEGCAPEVRAMTRASLAGLLARDRRQRTTLRWLEVASRAGGPVVSVVDALRKLVDEFRPTIRRRHYVVAADEMLRTAAVSGTDPVDALDGGGELIAGLVLEQARRSRQIDDLVGPDGGRLLRRAGAMAGR